MRLAWHDSGTFDQRIAAFPQRGGANAAIVHDPELTFGANAGLRKAVGCPPVSALSLGSPLASSSFVARRGRPYTTGRLGERRKWTKWSGIVFPKRPLGLGCSQQKPGV